MSLLSLSYSFSQARRWPAVLLTYGGIDEFDCAIKELSSQTRFYPGPNADGSTGTRATVTSSLWNGEYLAARLPACHLTIARQSRRCSERKPAKTRTKR